MGVAPAAGRACKCGTFVFVCCACVCFVRGCRCPNPACVCVCKKLLCVDHKTAMIAVYGVYQSSPAQHWRLFLDYHATFQQTSIIAVIIIISSSSSSSSSSIITHPNCRCFYSCFGNNCTMQSERTCARNSSQTTRGRDWNAERNAGGGGEGNLLSLAEQTYHAQDCDDSARGRWLGVEGWWSIARV